MSLPVDAVLPALRAALRDAGCAVLSAPPGAGKTTRVGPALLDEPWLRGRRIVMLEPRRLAARRAAEYMASERSEEPGRSVGYRIRGESRSGPETRIEVVTEGILTRMLQDDPALEGTGLVIFDEFHERSVHADLGLALAVDVRRHLRDDLRILVMSATLDTGPVASYLGGPVVETHGRSYPVDLRYAAFSREGPVEPRVAETVVRAMHRDGGDILVFLPGWREIHRTADALGAAAAGEEVDIHTLHGDAPYREQRRALEPSARRKVILSTSLAETSLTIDGVRIVVDSGLARASRFDVRRGMSALVTTAVSRATADQRAGRAGRQAPGVCYRLWTEAEHDGLPSHAPPEILVTDLAPLALELARWGDMPAFLDDPPSAHLSRAKTLLRELGALDRDGRITGHGMAMAGLGVHPRLAHMLLRARELGMGSLAADVAAVLEERDLLRDSRADAVDLRARLDALRTGGGDRALRARVLAEAHRLRMRLTLKDDPAADHSRAGLLLALAYPERIAQRREIGRFATVEGTAATLPERSALAREEFLAVADVDGAGAEVRIQLAAPLGGDDLMRAAGSRIVEEERTGWDSREEAVRAVRRRRLGELVLEERTLEPAPEARLGAMIEGIRAMGLAALPWDAATRSVLERSRWLRRQASGDWPDLSEERLLEDLPAWLGPFLGEARRREHLARVDLPGALRALLGHARLRELDRMAPTHLEVPTGSRIRLQYSDDGPPVLAVRLQEMFGERETPRVARGRVPVLIHLLSPAGRPLAVTRDLGSFWQNAYPEVRKEMRGRYPKHHWPENPLEALPTRRTKPRQG